MPEFDSIAREQIATLRAMQRRDEPVDVFELVKINWPSPDGAIWYGATHPDPDQDVPLPAEVFPLDIRLMASSIPDLFLPVEVGDTIGDEEIELKFWDGPNEAGESDGAFSDLMIEHGEGVKAELYYWFPQVELLLPIWYGHLRTEEDAEQYTLPIKAVQGFRSSEGNVPHRAHYEYCVAIFGGLATTQAEIDDWQGCPYNKQISGGTIGNNDPSTSQPWTYCDRLDHQSCIDRGVDPLYHLSHRTISRVFTNNQTQGPTLYSTTYGNQTALKEPVPVIMGRRRVRGMPCIAYRRDLNNNNPDHGWFITANEISEGPNRSFTDWGVTIGSVRLRDPIMFRYRSGQLGQTSLPMTTHGFSGTSVLQYAWGWVDPSTVSPSDVTADGIVEGLDNIRVYSDATTYTETYTTNRVWQIAALLTNKRWGYGLDYSRLHIPSWIEAAEWCDEYVSFEDANGETWYHQRSSSNVELRGKKVQQQVEDMCRAGRLSRPFIFDGKIHIMPLRELTSDELADCPVFTDEGDEPNICFDGEMSSLRISRISDLTLSNRIECTYEPAASDWAETPLRPLEDVDAQLRAGRVVGDHARKINAKKFNLLGVTDEPQGQKLQQALLDLGEFDEGGLANNCSLKMSIWFLDSLELFPTKVIKVVNTKLNSKYGFEYFRIKNKIERESNLKVKLELQAYNPDYMDSFETVVIPEDEPDECDPGYHWDELEMACVADNCPPGHHWDTTVNACVPDIIDPPCVLTLGTSTYSDGLLTIPIEPCP